MSRVKNGPYTKRRRKKWLAAGRGYWGSRSKLYKTARLQVMHGLLSAYRERRRKKRVYRALMITRISAGLQSHNMNYNSFMHGLKLAGVALDRSILSEMAIHSPDDFVQLVDFAKEQLNQPGSN